VIFAFDESPRTLLIRSAALGVNLRRHLDSGLVALQQVDPAEMSPGEFTYAVRQAVGQGPEAARVVVIDSLNGYLHAMPEERYLTLQLHELLTYLGQQGVLTLLVVAQHGLVGTGLQAPIDASYLADSVILLRYFEANGRLRRAISVVKKRSGAHEDTIRELHMGRGGVTVGEPILGFQGILTGVPSLVGEGTGTRGCSDRRGPERSGAARPGGRSDPGGRGGEPGHSYPRGVPSGRLHGPRRGVRRAGPGGRNGDPDGRDAEPGVLRPLYGMARRAAAVVRPARGAVAARRRGLLAAAPG
jgi:hypothetical protein